MAKTAQNGKGSRPRPLSISDDEFGDKWDAIFGKKPRKEESPCPPDDRLTTDQNTVSEL